MNDKIRYTNEPIVGVEIVADFLPSPAELAFREEGVKVTLALSRKSVDFFKHQASRHRTQYQRMIRRLLDNYVETQQASSSRQSARKQGRRKSTAARSKRRGCEITNDDGPHNRAARTLLVVFMLTNLGTILGEHFAGIRIFSWLL